MGAEMCGPSSAHLGVRFEGSIRLYLRLFAVLLAPQFPKP